MTCTDAVSAGSTAWTWRLRHHPMTGVTRKSVADSQSAGSTPTMSTPRRVEAGLLLGLAQRRRDGVGVGLVLAAAGEGDLARMGAHVGGTLEQQQLRARAVALAEQDEDRGAHAGDPRRVADG